MAEHRGGSGNFAEDREKASEAGKKADSTVGVILKMTLNVLQAGKKGGQNSHSGDKK
jgi:general stress protein YciG